MATEEVDPRFADLDAWPLAGLACFFSARQKANWRPVWRIDGQQATGREALIRHPLTPRLTDRDASGAQHAWAPGNCCAPAVEGRRGWADMTTRHLPNTSGFGVITARMRLCCSLRGTCTLCGQQLRGEIKGESNNLPKSKGASR